MYEKSKLKVNLNKSMEVSCSRGVRQDGVNVRLNGEDAEENVFLVTKEWTWQCLEP